MSGEAEIPGIRINKEQLDIICSRYYFASQFVVGKKVLEIGCGAGLGLGYLSQLAENVIGSDLNEDNLMLARRHYKNRVRLLQFDAHKIPFQDESFDVVVALATVNYLRLDEFLEESHRVLKKGGILVFCMPNKEIAGFRASPLSRRYYTIAELSEIMYSGFDAKFYGGFPVKGKPQRKHPLRNMILTIIGRGIGLIPKGEKIRGYLSRLILHTLVLSEEIESGMVDYIQPEYLPSGSSNNHFRVIYVVATVKKEGMER